MTRRLLISSFAIVASCLVTACSIEPPLHLRRAVQTKVQLSTSVNLELMWQLDWETRWQFNWDVSMLGPLGYQEPASMRMHIYTQGPDGLPVSHTVHNFMGRTSRLDVFLGTHDLLFHNNDSESLLFQTKEDQIECVESYTRIVSSGLKASSPVFTTYQKLSASTKADDPAEEPVALAPDALFSLYYPNVTITDNPEDYVYEDGHYVLKIEGNLTPATFIYLIQVKLLHNQGRVVGSNGGGAITGVAQGVDLMTRKTWDNTVSIPMDVYMDRSQDMLGARVLSFGIPGCNPYDAASLADAAAGRHFFVLNVSYVNGSWRNIHMDITDQVRALPLGGVITMEIDVDDFPPDESAGTGGGFNALVSDWNEEQGSTTIIN